MQLHAPRYEGAHKTRSDEEVQLSYSLDARPLSTQDVGSRNRIIRVSVELLNQQGKPVTPSIVVLDLLVHPDGNPRITRIRMEPVRPRHAHEPQSDRPWQMKFWQTQMGALFNHPSNKHPEAKHASSPRPESHEPAQDSEPTRSQDAVEAQSSSAADAPVAYILSPYWTPSTYSYQSHRRPHGRHRDHTFSRLVRPVILPALLGAAAGLVACLLGFLIGHILMALSWRLGLRKKRSQHRRSRSVHLEDGCPSEKVGLIDSEIHVTDLDE